MTEIYGRVLTRTKQKIGFRNNWSADEHKKNITTREAVHPNF